MRRAAAAIERVAVLLAGLVLLAVGGAGVAWEQGWLPEDRDRIDASAALEGSRESWWPWLIGLSGLLVFLLGLWWLLAHARRSTVGRLKLPGSGRAGGLVVDSSALLSAAAAVLEETVGVTSRDGRVWHDRRELVVELRAALDPGADLDEAADAAERAAAVLRTSLGPETPARCRVVLVRGRRWAKRSRVR